MNYLPVLIRVLVIAMTLSKITGSLGQQRSLCRRYKCMFQAVCCKLVVTSAVAARGARPLMGYHCGASQRPRVRGD